jgi:hypothetical protein
MSGNGYEAKSAGRGPWSAVRPLADVPATGFRY